MSPLDRSLLVRVSERDIATLDSMLRVHGLKRAGLARLAMRIGLERLSVSDPVEFVKLLGEAAHQ